MAGIHGRLLSVQPIHQLRLAQQKLTTAERELAAMSYRGVLKRGYSVTRGADGKVLRSTADAAVGDWIQTELTDGRLRSKVEKAPGE